MRQRGNLLQLLAASQWIYC